MDSKPIPYTNFIGKTTQSETINMKNGHLYDHIYNIKLLKSILINSSAKTFSFNIKL